MNGLYYVRLRAYDTANNYIDSVITVVVQGNQKVGYFTLSYNDLTLPVAGFPVTVTRTYDSRNKSGGDFGIGWTLSTSNVTLQKNGALGDGWNYNGTTLTPARSHVITITLPTGLTYSFAAQANPNYSIIGLEYTQLQYVPLPGTHGTLTPTAGAGDYLSVLTGSDGTAGNALLQDDLDGESSDTFDASEFVLTTGDGTQYDINQANGVQSITDLHGNTLRFSYGTGGVYNITSTSATGGSRGLTFTRTGGFITGIADPLGNTLTYVQNPNGDGDLTSFTDRVGNTSTYDYGAAHDLTGIHDARGVEPLRNTYDSTGKLISTTDANGNAIQYSYSAGGETITDRLGHKTDLTYDSYGNVTSMTKHLIVPNNPDHLITTRSVYNVNDPNNPSRPIRTVDALGYETDYSYDTMGHTLTITHKHLDPTTNTTVSLTTTNTYNGLGQMLNSTDPMGIVTKTNTYDQYGDLLTTADALGNTTRNTHNPDGTLATTTDALGHVTKYGYDSFGEVTTLTDATGHAIAFTYDVNGRKTNQTTTLTNAQGQTQTLAAQSIYDANGNEVQSVAPDQTSTQTVYNSIGKIDHTINELGRVTQTTYDNLGQLIQTTYADGTSTSTAFDADGNHQTQTDKAGRVTLYGYDSLNRRTTTTEQDNLGHTLGVSTDVYDDDGQVVQSTDANGHTTKTTYDDLGRKISATDALGFTTTYQYDLDGRQTAVTDANGHTTTYDYDDKGQEIAVTYADGSTSTTDYDALGQRISTTDQANHTKQFTYDALGRLSAVTDALGLITTYGYDELGNKISQTDAKGRTTKFAYNIVSKLVSKQLPAGQTMSMTYNADNTLASQTDYNTNQTFFDYDTVGNLLDKKDSTGRLLVIYTYNPDGSQNTATRNTYTTGNTPATTFTTTNTYDAYGRLQGVANPNGTLQYTYDAVGNKLSVVDPGKSLTTTYAYDADDRLQGVTHPGGAVTTYTYDKVGNRQSVIRPNHVTTTYTYDHLNRLTDVVNANAATRAVVSSYHYTLDADGKRLSVTDSTGATTSYGYDADSRLTSEATASGTTSYVYDSVGNRLSKTSGGTTITFTYDADDRNSSSAYTYNANGDVLNDGTHTYSYDFEDHLTGSGTQTTQTATYAYDADGTRIQKIDGTGTTNYLVDSNRTYAEVLEERDGSGNVLARYDYGDDLIRMDRGSLTRYYLFDGLGSTRQLTDGTGAVTDTYAYDAFGNLVAQTGSTVNPYLFNGQEQDAGTGLYYLRARYMSPADGRFISQDPYEGDDEDPISLHRYLYASADPVNRVDPGGEDDLVSTIEANGIVVEENAETNSAAIGVEQAADEYELAASAAGRLAYQVISSPGGIFAARAILVYALGLPALLTAIAYSTSNDDDNNAPAYLFRGTTVGFDGGVNAQRYQVTDTSSDPAVATIFAVHKRDYRDPVVEIASLNPDLTGLAVEPAAPFTDAPELGWYVWTSPSDFANRASLTISADDSRNILLGMGISIPYRIGSQDREGLSYALKSIAGKHLSPVQISDYLTQAQKYRL